MGERSMAAESLDVHVVEPGVASIQVELLTQLALASELADRAARGAEHALEMAMATLVGKEVEFYGGDLSEVCGSYDVELPSFAQYNWYPARLLDKGMQQLPSGLYTVGETRTTNDDRLTTLLIGRVDDKRESNTYVGYRAVTQRLVFTDPNRVNGE